MPFTENEMFWSKKKVEAEKIAPIEEKKQINPQPTLNGAAGVKNILAVAAGKGGVGKSTVSVNLAKTLQLQGFKVGILDADLHGPSIPIMLSVMAPTEMRGQLIVPPMQEGIKIISASMFSSQSAHIMRGPMAGNFIRQLLIQTDWGSLDYLIIDYPPGTGDIQLTLSQSCNLSGAILVSSPQEVALADVRKAYAMFETMRVPVLGIVETMSWFSCDACEKKHFIFKKEGGKNLANELGLPLLAQIPLDPRITEAGDSGTSFVQSNPESTLFKSFFSLGEEIQKELSHLQYLSKEGLLNFSLKWQNN